MSDLANAHLQSDQDVAPLLLAAHVLRTDNEALEAAHTLAASALEHAAKRDRQRKLPWSHIEAFTRSGLGSISIPREFGGPQVSFVTLAEVFAIISAADPALGQIPQNQVGVLNLILSTANQAQKEHLFASVLQGWRIGNAGPERGTKNTLDLKARITPPGRPCLPGRYRDRRRDEPVEREYHVPGARRHRHARQRSRGSGGERNRAPSGCRHTCT